MDSAGLMESTVLLQTCVKLPDASTSLCMMLMTLAGLGRRTLGALWRSARSSEQLQMCKITKEDSAAASVLYK